MLYADHGISFVYQFSDDPEQILLFIFMETYCRLIKYKNDGIYLGNDIRGEEQTLYLPARQAGKRPVQRQIRQSHIAQAFQFSFQLLLKRALLHRKFI